MTPVDGADTVRAVLIGDSHSIAWLPGVQAACRKNGFEVAFYGANLGTSPFFVPEGARAEDYYFAGWDPEQRIAFDRHRREFLDRHTPALVFVCARWSNFADWDAARLKRHLDDLTAASPGSTFVFIGQPPELPFGSDGFVSGRLDLPAFRHLSESPQVTARRTKVHRALSDYCTDSPRFRFIDTSEPYLGEGGVVLKHNGELLYVDDDHLSVAGALHFSSLADHVRDILNAVQSAVSPGPTSSPTG